jgi:hypothetical protein
MSRRILLAAALLAVAALSGCATRGAAGEPRAEPDTATACVYLIGHDGARYALAYGDRRCTREGYLPLPLDQFDPLDKWSSNSKYMDVLSALDVYRISARLATRDERSEHGNWGVHGLFTRWSEYKWAEHTTEAYHAAVYGLGRRSAITQSLEASLLRRRFAKKRNDVLVSNERKLSAREKADLLALLAATEAELAREERMRFVRRTVEDAARAASPEDQDRIRRNLSKFRVE